MSDKLYSVAVDFDHPATSGEMQSIATALNEELDHDAIVTEREVEPLEKDDLMD